MSKKYPFYITLLLTFCFLGLVMQEAQASEIKPKSIKASSTYKASAKRSYDVKQLVDNDATTPWVAAAGRGKGEWLEFSFGKELDFTAIAIRNGYQRTETSYKNNSRAAKISLKADGKQLDVLTLKDIKDWQKFSLPNVKATKLSFHIESIYKSNADLEVALADMRFYVADDVPVTKKDATPKSAPAVKNTPEVKVQKPNSEAKQNKANTKQPINTTKKYLKFLDQLTLFTDADAAVKNLERSINSPIETPYTRGKHNSDITKRAFEVCKAMQAGQESHDGKPILQGFMRSFPHHGGPEPYAALLGLYAQNPYFDIPHTTLDHLNNHFASAKQQFETFTKTYKKFISYFPHQSHIEGLLYLHHLDVFMAELSKYRGYVGQAEMMHTLSSYKNAILNDLKVTNSTRSPKGLELYRGWTSGMSICEIYEKMCNDGLAYGVLVPSSTATKHKVHCINDCQDLTDSRPYDASQARNTLSIPIDLSGPYYYPGERGREIEAHKPIIRHIFSPETPYAGTFYNIYLENAMALLVHSDLGLITVKKQIEASREDLFNSLIKKYGENDVNNMLLSKYKKKGLKNYIKTDGPDCYIGSKDDLYIFVDSRYNIIHYSDKKILDQVFTEFLQGLKEQDRQAEQKRDALQDEI